jgi:hypothetical protein
VNAAAVARFNDPIVPYAARFGLKILGAVALGIVGAIFINLISAIASRGVRQAHFDTNKAIQSVAAAAVHPQPAMRHINTGSQASGARLPPASPQARENNK